MHAAVSVAGRVQFTQPGSEEGHKSLLFSTSCICIGWLGSGSQMFFSLICNAVQLGGGERKSVGKSFLCLEGTILHQWSLKNVVGATHAGPRPDMKACYESQFWHQGHSDQSTSCSAPRAPRPFSVPQGWYF